jgi:Protein ChrB, N-terminal
VTDLSWVVLVVKMPSEPARHRIGLWRELRRIGAVPLGQGTWALPELPVIEPALTKLRHLSDTAGGNLLVLRAHGVDTENTARLEQLYRVAREQDWAEFRADCGKYLAELDREEEIDKYTLAELDEEEHSLDRLRRWFRDLRARDLLGSPAASDADQQLKRCVERFDRYAEGVYRRISRSAPSDW